MLRTNASRVGLDPSGGGPGDWGKGLVVETNPDHAAYLGAQVGSNNTGKLSGILVALLFADERNMKSLVIHSDGQWAINVSLGKWRAKSHKTIINQIRQIIRQEVVLVKF